ncbi:hypothetical protein LUZ63_022358 [Rhynchospora breviuscula]|uniref:Small ribosomal subunit protein uS10 domain-containing protein n=1 Tax=Rhynchospora breviuscula TaxID=2022672 RepID=A0A9P9Z4W5_9POAL|nr:hypothetical protein LUZ63_022358 [Rhynchospora breviuscula]
MAGQKIRIRLKSYDHAGLDSSARKIVDTVTRAGATVVGPVPLPTEKNVIAVIRSPHKYKDSREHFEMRTHKRLISSTSSTRRPGRRLADASRPPGRCQHRDQALRSDMADINSKVSKGLLGTKLGMTQVWNEQGKLVPVTVIEISPNVVTQVRTPRRTATTPFRSPTARSTRARSTSPSRLTSRPRA